MKKIAFLTVLSISALLALSSAYAAALPGTVPLVPGSTVIPGDTTTAPAGTLLASLSAPFTTTLSGTTGTVTSAVFRNATGTLDFYYQITNSANSLDSVVRTTDSNFTGFNTFTGFRTDGPSLTGGSFTTGTAIPFSSDRSLSGSVVGFNFGPVPENAILPGAASAVMVISTNATAFTTGNVSVIDGGVATVAAFEPTAIPEPTSVALLTSGLAGLGLFAWRRKK